MSKAKAKRVKKEFLLSKLQGKELKKIIIRREAPIEREEDLLTEWIVLMNVSYDSGVDGEMMVSALKQLGFYDLVASIEMYDGQKCYSYLQAVSKEAALSIYNALDNVYVASLKRTLFLGLAVEVPFNSFLPRPISDPLLIEKMVPGAMLILDFLQIEEEAAIQAEMDTLTLNSPWETLNKRSVQHFGYRFDYPSNLVEKDALPDTPLPQTTLPHLARAQKILLEKDPTSYASIFAPHQPDLYFNQLTINKYNPGDGIAPHTDSVDSFGTTILIISLHAPILMEFTPPSTTDTSQVVLPPRSLLVLGGEARREWTHGIRNRKVDVVDGLVLERSPRLSLTFRHVRSCRES